MDPVRGIFPSTSAGWASPMEATAEREPSEGVLLPSASLATVSSVWRGRLVNLRTGAASLI